MIHFDGDTGVTTPQKSLKKLATGELFQAFFQTRLHGEIEDGEVAE
ncbi:MAG TPA: hypothetical protein V6C84_08250 [Coleofasciculaceae cyanobacterium]|jgi:hypothetical protein